MGLVCAYLFRLAKSHANGDWLELLIVEAVKRRQLCRYLPIGSHLMVRHNLDEALPRARPLDHGSLVTVSIFVSNHWTHHRIFRTSKLNALLTLTLSKHVCASKNSCSPFFRFLLLVEPHLYKTRITSNPVLHAGLSVDILGRWISFKRGKVASLARLERIIVTCSIWNFRVLLK